MSSFLLHKLQIWVSEAQTLYVQQADITIPLLTISIPVTFYKNNSNNNYDQYKVLQSFY